MDRPKNQQIPTYIKTPEKLPDEKSRQDQDIPGSYVWRCLYLFVLFDVDGRGQGSGWGGGGVGGRGRALGFGCVCSGSYKG